MNQLLTVEVAEYVDAVDAALADLPEDIRAELLEDLPAHLTDVLAEGAVPRDRLGEPAAYAAELRAAAGLPDPTPAARRWDVTERLRAIDARLGTAIGYPRASEFARALLPAWWVLRAYLLVQLVTGAQGRTGAGAVVPLVDGNAGFGLLLLLAALVVSIWLGRRPAGRWAFAASVVVAIGLLGYSTLLVQYAVRDNTVYVGDEGTSGPLGGVTNIYPIGPDGKVIKNVRLLKQDGGWIELDGSCPDSAEFDPSAEPTAPLYPVTCPTNADGFDPRTGLAPLPGATPSRSTAPSPSR